ncbi:uncharacterized protein LOC123518083 isoform X1 [Portunus trituberculatus]|uniref:uncharacterized protein LOC123518083 isoform X1 n=1 Tax=Portunus trituberculatus TaxID=210409 RepID=UPI001E1CB51B|nr:uncharacterized protein LOC123518083 isoform X1 [Portunus trituberculatus]
MVSAVRRLLILPVALLRAGVFNVFITLVAVIPPLRAVCKWWFKTLVPEGEDGGEYMKPITKGVGHWSMFWERIKCHFYIAWAEVQMVAEQGSRAPNPKLLRLSDRSECRLLDVASKGRPLIINFGSCT